jgi:hypothetical protein
VVPDDIVEVNADEPQEVLEVKTHTVSWLKLKIVHQAWVLSENQGVDVD